MAIKTVEYVASERLSCAYCPPAEVYLCVKEGIVAQHPCPLTAGDPPANTPPQITTETDFEWRFIEATIERETFVRNSCANGQWRYVISYDDVQIIEAERPLVVTDIEGILCRGCLTTFIESVAGQEVKLEIVNPEAGPDQLVLTSQHGCQFSVDLPGGFFVAADSGPTQEIDPAETLSILGGDSIDTLAIAPNTIEVSVALSTDPNNQAAFGSDGNLYIPPIPLPTCEEVQDCVGTMVAPSQGLVYDDGGNTLSVSVPADPDNSIVINPGGLFSYKSFSNSVSASGSAAGLPVVLNTGVPVTVPVPGADVIASNPSTTLNAEAINHASFATDISFASDSVVTVTRETRLNGGAWSPAQSVTYQPGVAIRLLQQVTNHAAETFTPSEVKTLESRLVVTKTAGGATTLHSAGIIRSLMIVTTE